MASMPRPTASCVPWRTASSRRAISSALATAVVAACCAARPASEASTYISPKIAFICRSRSSWRCVAAAMVSLVKIAAKRSQENFSVSMPFSSTCTMAMPALRTISNFSDNQVPISQPISAAASTANDGLQQARRGHRRGQRKVGGGPRRRRRRCSGNRRRAGQLPRR